MDNPPPPPPNTNPSLPTQPAQAQLFSADSFHTPANRAPITPRSETSSPNTIINLLGDDRPNSVNMAESDVRSMHSSTIAKGEFRPIKIESNKPLPPEVFTPEGMSSLFGKKDDFAKVPIRQTLQLSQSALKEQREQQAKLSKPSLFSNPALFNNSPNFPSPALSFPFNTPESSQQTPKDNKQKPSLPEKQPPPLFGGFPKAELPFGAPSQQPPSLFGNNNLGALFGNGNEAKPEKKKDENQHSLFGLKPDTMNALFGNPPNPPPNPALFAFPTKTQDKKEEKKQKPDSSPSFFSNPMGLGLLNTKNAEIKPDTTSKPVLGSLFGANPPAFGLNSEVPSFGLKTDASSFGQKSDLPLFGQKSEMQALSQKSDMPAFGQKNETPALGLKFETSAIGQKNTPLFGQKSESLSFGQKTQTPALGGLFAGIPSLTTNKPAEPQPPKTDKMVFPSILGSGLPQPTNAQSQKPALFGGFSLNFEKKEDQKPANVTTFTNPLQPVPSGQPQQDPKANLGSLFAGITGIPIPATTPPNIPNIPPATPAFTSSFIIPKQTVQDTKPPTQIKKTNESISSLGDGNDSRGSENKKQTLNSTANATLQEKPRKIMSLSKPPAPPKPKNIRYTAKLIKKQLETGALTSNGQLTETGKRINSYIKQYFSTKETKWEEPNNTHQPGSLEGFELDIANLLFRILQLHEGSYQMIKEFVTAELEEEEYMLKLFPNGKLDDGLAERGQVYYIEKEGDTPKLNLARSLDLQQLVSRLLKKWNTEKMSILVMVTQHPSLMLPPSDLFPHLFTYFLRYDQLNDLSHLQGPALSKYKPELTSQMLKLNTLLYDVIFKINIRYHDKNLLSLHHLIKCVNLVDRVAVQHVIRLSLKVLLNGMNFQPGHFSRDLVQTIMGTSSQALLPFRVILGKMKLADNVQAQPQDIFFYIEGDEWYNWLETYLSSPNANVCELEKQVPTHLTNSITTLLPSRLQRCLMDPRSGVGRFFRLLRDEGLDELSYRILEMSLTDMDSVLRIQQEFFKYGYNSDFQDVLDYVVQFNHSLTQLTPNDQKMAKVLPAKVSYISRLMVLDTERIIDIEESVFEVSEPLLRRRYIESCGRVVRPGFKLFNFLADTLNICSFRSWHEPKLFTSIFKAFTAMAGSSRFKGLLFHGINVNRPLFTFASKPLGNICVKAINGFIVQAISSRSFYDLIQGYNLSDEQLRICMQIYPSRYLNNDLHDLQGKQQKGKGIIYTFSLYWLSHLLRTAALQSFDPILINAILQKFLIPLGKNSKELKSSQTPILLKEIALMINTFNTWQQIMNTLKYSLQKTKDLPILQNDKLREKDSELYVFNVLKLFRTLLRLTAYLKEHEQDTIEYPFMRMLSSLTILTQIERSGFIQKYNSFNVLLSLFAFVRSDLPTRNSSNKLSNLIFELRQDNSSRLTYFNQYLQRNQKNLNFQLISSPIICNDKYYDAEESCLTLALQCLIALFKMHPHLNLSDPTLYKKEVKTYNLNLPQELQIDGQTIRDNLFATIARTFTQCLSSPQLAEGPKLKIVTFFCDLKFGVGKNRQNRLAEVLSGVMMNQPPCNPFCPKISKAILQYILLQLQEKQYVQAQFIEQAIVDCLKHLDIRRDESGERIKLLGKVLKYYHSKPILTETLNHLERLVDQRYLLSLGDQIDCLRMIVEIVTLQLTEESSFDILTCTSKLNELLASEDLAFLESELQYTPTHSQNLNWQNPRHFLEDPLETFYSAGKEEAAILIQKRNVTQWFIHTCRALSKSLTNYFSLIFTIDFSLYSNNPVPIKIRRNDLLQLPLFSFLAPEGELYSAIELFGLNEQSAIATVQLLCENFMMKANIFKKDTPRYPSTDSSLMEKSLQLAGLSLEWLRSKKGLSESFLRKITRQAEHLIFEQEIIEPAVMKVFLSLLTFASPHFTTRTKLQIRKAITHLLTHYLEVQRMKPSEQDIEFKIRVQEAIPLLLASPPDRNEVGTFAKIVEVWATETNPNFFFNESRLVLELCNIYPEEMVKLHPLTSCSMLQRMGAIRSRYSDGDRCEDSIAWLWLVKIATAITNHPESNLVVPEAAAFCLQEEERILQILSCEQEKASKAYLQDLQAVLELLIAMFSHPTWVQCHHPLIERLNHTLAHQTIKIFVSFAQSRLKMTVGSSNDKALGSVEPLQKQQGKENIFRFEIRLRMINCLRNYCLLMQKSFKSSLYVETQFNQNGGDLHFMSSFWENYNRHLACLFQFALRQLRSFTQAKYVPQQLALLQSCLNAPTTFVENGYLPSILEYPRSDRQLIGTVYVLNYLLCQLATLHYLKQKLFLSKNAQKNRNALEQFAKKITENIKSLRTQSPSMENYEVPVGERNFDRLRVLVMEDVHRIR